MSTILTPTEWQIAGLILQGYGRGEIAEKLGSGLARLTKSLNQMYAKLAIEDDGVHSRFMQLAMLIHEQRNELGLTCEACEDLRSESASVKGAGSSTFRANGS